MWKHKYPLQNEATSGEEGGAAAGAVETAEDSTESDVNWGGIADDLVAEDEGLDVEGELEVVEKAEGEPPKTVESTPTAEPAAASTPTPATEEPASTDPTPAPTPITPTPAPAVTEEEYGTWRTQRLTQLEQMYALDEEAATALLTEPETVLPKLAARVHMEVLENSMRAMQAMVPVMMQQVQHHTDVESKARSYFTQVNPDLSNPDYEPAIMQLGEVYRRVNPQAPADKAARDIGNLVRAALGLAAAPAGQVAQSAPPPQVATPFTPARGAGGGRPAAAPSNPYEALALEFLNED